MPPSNSNQFNSNTVPALFAMSNADGQTPVYLWANPTTHGLIVEASVTLAAENIPATNLTEAVAVQIVDGSGDQITSFGGGTQYADGDAIATPTGTVVMGTDGSNVFALHTNTSGDLQIDVLSSALPTGAATAAKQDTSNTSVANIDTNLGAQADTVASSDTGAFSLIALIKRNTQWQTTQAGYLQSLAGTVAGTELQVDVLTMPTTTVQATNLDIRDLTSVSDSVAAVQSGSWTVTANAGTNLNTSALALESGGNLAGVAASLAVIDDWDESDRAKVNPIVGQVGVQGGSGAVSATTQRVVLATDVALPAGTNAIGKLSANSGVDIGDVDVTSEVSSTFDHGSNRDVDTSAEQITTTSIAAKFGVVVKAANANTGTIYVGNSDVTAGTTDATDGFELGGGESVLVKVDNANKVYVIGSATNQIVYWMVV